MLVRGAFLWALLKGNRKATSVLAFVFPTAVLAVDIATIFRSKKDPDVHVGASVLAGLFGAVVMVVAGIGYLDDGDLLIALVTGFVGLALVARAGIPLGLAQPYVGTVRLP